LWRILAGHDGMSGLVTSESLTAKVGRNDPCPCGSGRKYKHCCHAKEPGAQFAANQGIRSSPAEKLRLNNLFAAAKQHVDAARLADAVAALAEIVQLDPSSATAHYNLGAAYLRYGRFADAAASLQRAVDLQPGDEKALQSLAATLSQVGRAPEARSVYRKLSRAASDPLERRHYLAKALEIEGKLEEAELELRRVLAVAPKRPASRVLLGQLLLRRGAFEEAQRHLTEAVDALPLAFRSLTKAKRMTESDRPLIDRMRLLVERPGLDLPSRASVRFGLGKAFDDLGDYAEAMRHYDAGNRLYAMAGRLDRAAMAAKYDSIVARFTAETLARAEQGLSGSDPSDGDLPVFIFGMPRSGTTLVEQILSSHPAVAAGDELRFWQDRAGGDQASGLEALDADALARAAEAYRAELRAIGPRALRVTDKAPGNFERLGLLRLALPDARFVHCRRHPVDTCLSIFFEPFAGAESYACDRGDLVFAYRQYERLMEHWRRVLPPERFTEVEYEALVSDRDAETRRLVAFCGLEWDDACLAPQRNERALKTASLWQARQPVYTTSVNRWRRFEPWLGELQELMPRAET
jgi:tetratricopeptide (TPR) repeat protein